MPTVYYPPLQDIATARNSAASVRTQLQHQLISVEQTAEPYVTRLLEHFSTCDEPELLAKAEPVIRAKFSKLHEEHAQTTAQLRSHLSIYAGRVRKAYRANKNAVSYSSKEILALVRALPGTYKKSSIRLNNNRVYWKMESLKISGIWVHDVSLKLDLTQAQPFITIVLNGQGITRSSNVTFTNLKDLWDNMMSVMDITRSLDPRHEAPRLNAPDHTKLSNYARHIASIESVMSYDNMPTPAGSATIIVNNDGVGPKPRNTLTEDGNGMCLLDTNAPTISVITRACTTTFDLTDGIRRLITYRETVSAQAVPSERALRNYRALITFAKSLIAE